MNRDFSRSELNDELAALSPLALHLTRIYDTPDGLGCWCHNHTDDWKLEIRKNLIEKGQHYHWCHRFRDVIRACLSAQVDTGQALPMKDSCPKQTVRDAPRAHLCFARHRWIPYSALLCSSCKDTGQSDISAPLMCDMLNVLYADYEKERKDEE